MRAAFHRAVAFRLAADLADIIDQLGFELLMPLGRPLAEPDQMARQALDRVAIESPIVIRLDGTNADEGRAILANAGIPESKLTSQPTMLDAARAAVAMANA